MTSADLARANNWTVGTRLISTDGAHTCTIQITAVGIQKVLAVCEPHQSDHEASWDLTIRQWRRI